MEWPLWSVAAAIGTVSVWCVAMPFSFWLGRVWARSLPAAMACGLMVGFLCAAIHMASVLAVTAFWPGLTSGAISLCFAVLCVAAPIGGPIAAWLSHRA